MPRYIRGRGDDELKWIRVWSLGCYFKWIKGERWWI